MKDINKTRKDLRRTMKDINKTRKGLDISGRI